jgi:hypothetical protein
VRVQVQDGGVDERLKQHSTHAELIVQFSQSLSRPAVKGAVDTLAKSGSWRYGPHLIGAKHGGRAILCCRANQLTRKGWMRCRRNGVANHPCASSEMTAPVTSRRLTQQ